MSDRVIRYIAIQRNIDKEPILGRMMIKAVAGEISGIASLLFHYGAENLNVNYFRKEDKGVYKIVKCIITFNIDEDVYEYLKDEKLGSLANNS